MKQEDIDTFWDKAKKKKVRIQSEPQDSEKDEEDYGLESDQQEEVFGGYISSQMTTRSKSKQPEAEDVEKISSNKREAKIDEKTKKSGG